MHMMPEPSVFHCYWALNFIAILTDEGLLQATLDLLPEFIQG